VCTLYPRASRLEWLLTNGTGGFAMGTVAGSNTRRYHGLLVASLHPPVARVVTLARLEETAFTSQGPVPLSVNQYPNALHPDGYRWLAHFSLEEGPVWTWSVFGVEVERRVLLVPGQQTVLVRYASSAPVRLRLEPLLAFRDYHALTHRNSTAWTGFEEHVVGKSREVRFQPYASLPSLRLSHRGGPFTGAPAWHENVEYLVELDRGLDFREDLLCPGSFELQLDPGAPELVAATVEAGATLDLDALSASFSRVSPAARRREASPPVTGPPDLAAARGRLERAAEAYPVRRADGSATVIAGYPWFTDWGRDTMISLPGLLLARGAWTSRARCWRASSPISTAGWSPTDSPTRPVPPSTTPRTRRCSCSKRCTPGNGPEDRPRSSTTCSTRRPAPSWTRTSAERATASTWTRATGCSSPEAREAT